MTEPVVDGREVVVGCYVRVLSLSQDGWRYPEAEEVLRRSAIGRICRIVEPYEGTSEDGLRTSSGEYRAHYAILSAEGIAGYSLYLDPHDIEMVAPTEEMLLLYSDDVWQLIRPYGEVQDTPTFKKLAAYFGLVGSQSSSAAG